MRESTAAVVAASARKAPRLPPRTAATRAVRTAAGRRRTVAPPAYLTLHRHVVPTAFGPFSVLTDGNGAVRLCDWHSAEAARLQAVQDRWYRGTTLRVVDGEAAGPGAAAAHHLRNFFNAEPGTAAAALQRELDAVAVAMPAAGDYTTRVWQTLRECVPAGEALTYSQLGELVRRRDARLMRAVGEGAGKPQGAIACRAVGQAMAQNPIPIIVPCHRVIGSTGGLHGYGCGLEKKVWLLRHEGAAVPDAAKLAAVETEKRVSTPASRR